MAQTQSINPGKAIVENVAVAVPAAGNTTLLDIPTDDASFMGVSILNSGAQPLDTFIVQGRFSPDDAYQNILSLAADYTTPAGIVVDASGDLTVLAAGASGWLLLNVLPFYSVRILASANVAGATTVTARAIARA